MEKTTSPTPAAKEIFAAIPRRAAAWPPSAIDAELAERFGRETHGIGYRITKNSRTSAPRPPRK